MSANNRVFISCASREFQQPGAPFAGLRERLARHLVRADCEVKWQETFRRYWRLHRANPTVTPTR